MPECPPKLIDHKFRSTLQYDCYSLYVARPEEVATVLGTAAADLYREKVHQTQEKVWSDIALIVDRAARDCQRAVKKLR